MTHEEAILVSAYTGFCLTKQPHKMREYAADTLEGWDEDPTAKDYREKMQKELKKRLLPAIKELIEREMPPSSQIALNISQVYLLKATIQDYGTDAAIKLIDDLVAPQGGEQYVRGSISGDTAAFIE